MQEVDSFITCSRSLTAKDSIMSLVHNKVRKLQFFSFEKFIVCPMMLLFLFPFSLKLIQQCCGSGSRWILIFLAHE